MTVATALAVSWNPLTNSKPSAMSSATPSKTYGQVLPNWTVPRSFDTWKPIYPRPPRSATRTMTPLIHVGNFFFIFRSRSDAPWGSAPAVVAMSAIGILHRDEFGSVQVRPGKHIVRTQVGINEADEWGMNVG